MRLLGVLLVLGGAAEEFFPPNALETPCDYEGTKQYCTCQR